jgi:hypothetical protein
LASRSWLSNGSRLADEGPRSRSDVTRYASGPGLRSSPASGLRHSQWCLCCCLSAQRGSDHVSTGTSGHVGLVYPSQRLLDGEQAAVQAVADDALKLRGGRLRRDVNHCANGRSATKATDGGDIGFRDVVVPLIGWHVGNVAVFASARVASSTGRLTGRHPRRVLMEAADFRGREPWNANSSWISADNESDAGDRWHARGQGLESPQLHSRSVIEPGAGEVPRRWHARLAEERDRRAGRREPHRSIAPVRPAPWSRPSGQCRPLAATLGTDRPARRWWSGNDRDHASSQPRSGRVRAVVADEHGGPGLVGLSASTWRQVCESDVTAPHRLPRRQRSTPTAQRPSTRSTLPRPLRRRRSVREAGV